MLHAPSCYTLANTQFPRTVQYSESNYIHSLCISSYDRSIASFRASPRQSAIWCSRFQFPASSCFFKTIQQMLASSCSSFRHLYSPFLLSFNNLFYKAVPTRYVRSPISLPSLYCSNMQDCPTLIDPKLYFIFLMIGQTEILQTSPKQHLKTCQVFFINLPKCSNFGVIQSYTPNVGSH